MRAAVLGGYHKNGCELELKEVSIPQMGSHDILVKICAAGVNPLDNMIVRGDVKAIVPYKFPLVMGNEFVGTVEQVGAAAKKFAVGERVYGRMPLARIGAFAEYAALDEGAVARVPDYLSDEEAACVPLTALTALQAFELMEPSSGETVFISGGTGSLGAMAIPVAKSYGLTVFTNGSADNRERVLALGVDRFFDYKTEDYTQILSGVDHVLDTLGGHELEREFSVLKEGGSLVSLRGMPNGEFAKRTGMSLAKKLMFKVAGLKHDRMAAKKRQKYFFVFVHEDGTGLERVSRIFEDRHIAASVDEVFPLDEVNAALAKVAAGKSRGKTILRIKEG